MKEEHEVEVVHVPFELRPDIPDEGIYASEHGMGHSERVDAHLRRLAENDGVPLVFVDHIPKSHKAMLMAELARDAGLYGPVHKGIFHAYFGEGQDIGDEGVLLRVASEAGLDPQDVEDMFANGTYEERLHAYRQLGVDLGVSSTPSALICNELMIGSRPYGVIRDAVERCLVTEENVETAASYDAS